MSDFDLSDLSDPYDPDAYGGRPQPASPRPAMAPARVEGVTPPPPPVDREDALPPPPAPAPEETAAAPAETAGSGPVPWKAAASSVPRLRQKPVSRETPAVDDEFPGFAQDAPSVRGATMIGERHGPAERSASGDDPGAPATPLSAEPPFWELWLERARALPLPLVLGAGAVLAVALVLFAVLRPRDESTVSLARIRQHPEAYDGRQVAVSGRAGEAFSVGGSYVFNLRQGRDSIVVYSRTRRPSLHERVSATGTVSIGYLDGVPRVALFEASATP